MKCSLLLPIGVSVSLLGCTASVGAPQPCVQVAPSLASVDTTVRDTAFRDCLLTERYPESACEIGGLIELPIAANRVDEGTEFQFNFDFEFDDTPRSPFFECVVGEDRWFQFHDVLVRCGAADEVALYISKTSRSARGLAVRFPEYPKIRDETSNGTDFHDMVSFARLCRTDLIISFGVRGLNSSTTEQMRFELTPGGSEVGSRRVLVLPEGGCLAQRESDRPRRPFRSKSP